MITPITAGLITAGLATGGNILGNLLNYSATKNANATNAQLTRDTNVQNMAMFNQQMDWTKYQQQQTWNREDTGYQRAVNDAQNAGLSALAINGASSAGSLASSPSAPQMQAAQVMPYQFDFNGLADGARALQSAVIEDSRMSFNSKENELNRIASSVSLDKQIEATRANLTQQLENQSSIVDKQTATQIQIALDNINYERDAESKRMKFEKQQEVIQALRSVGVTRFTSKGFDSGNIEQAQADYWQQFNEFVSTIEPDAQSVGSSASDSDSKGGSLGANTLGLGGSVGLNFSSSSSTSENSSFNQSQKVDNQIKSWFASHPYPLLDY